MTSTRTIVKTAAALLGALAIGATPAAAADGGPGLTAGTGCTVQCITEVSVHRTTTTALISPVTTVPADLTVSIKKQVSGAATGGLAAPAWTVKHLYDPAHIAYFTDLEPDTTYAIVVTATDLQGQSSTKQGTFTTGAVKTSGVVGPATFNAGLGCGAHCITQARFWQTAPDGSVEHAHLTTSTSADIELVVFPDTGDHDVVFDAHAAGARSWKPAIGGLQPGTTYDVIVRATDLKGRTDERWGTFHTVSATAHVTIWKLKIVNDGDAGANKGELSFSYFGGDEMVLGPYYRRIGSGEVIPATAADTSREGVSFDLPADGDAQLDVGVVASECDDYVTIDDCARATYEDDPTAANRVAHDDYDTAYVGGLFDLQDILHDTSLPPWYGTGVTPPPGHDGYFTFGPGDRYVKILALATVDMHYEWPS